MKRRSFIQYLVGIAATLGASLTGKLAHASSGRDTNGVKPEATHGFQPTKSGLRSTGKVQIKVVGIGGAGANMVDRMIREGLGGVEFVCVDTDAEALMRSSADIKLQLTLGLGSGDHSDQSVDDLGVTVRTQIAEVVGGADLVFIIAGMGGNTGTSVAVAVAEVARTLGIVTVALVTKPLSTEVPRLAKAENGIAELDKLADTLIVTDNAEMMCEMEDWGEPVTAAEAFEASDGCLSRWVSNIADVINVPSLVDIGFADVCAVLGEPGITTAGRTGPTVTCGDDWDDGVCTQSIRTARSCADTAIYYSEADGFKLSRARSIMVTVMGDTSLGIEEVGEVMKQIRSRAAPDAKIVVGTIHDAGMTDFLRVSLIAKGFGDPAVTLKRKQ
jgi:cell division protein FtsZ